jgi:Abortive infection alpha
MSEPDPADDDLLRALPGLARIAGTAWVRTADWTVRASVDATRGLFRSAVSGEAPTELFRRTGADVRDWARGVLGIVETAGDDLEDANRPEPEPARDDLRERGAELLRRSADVRADDDGHPAYERILEDLAPDEARILRLLMLEGAQPSVDVRAGMPLASQLVAPGRNMIGTQAGCRHVERVPAYLNNLSRLGLIWFSRESLEDPRVYQVLEAQPEVVEAMRKAGRTGRTVRRSILLTPFGRNFCDACLPVDAVSD